ncbi:MAG: outer membrane beta-barrel protein [bacterium]|nr:outer membrane beta-barrel protein [bacterium]
MRRAIISLLLVMVLSLQITAAWAQSRSTTGRHRPRAQVDAEAAADTIPAPPRNPGWFLGFTGGAGAGSDLFSADVVNETPVRWASDAAFVSDHFNASLDGAAEFGLFFGRRLDDRISLRGDLAWTDMAVAAEARTGQVGDVYRYDSMSILTASVGGEIRLVRTASHPYMGASLVLAKLSPNRNDDLAQTKLGGRLSLGYQYVLDRQWSLRLEGRVTRTGFGVGDWVPVVATNLGQPEVAVDEQSDLTTWGLVLGVQLDLAGR